VRKWLLVLAVVVALGLALVTWLGVEDERQAARQAAILHAREQEAVQRERRAFETRVRARTPEEVSRAIQEQKEARAEVNKAVAEEDRRNQSWHARLRAEVRRRTGW
jgi:uncharacterized protein HemX